MRSVCGFSLIEVLVATGVLVAGLLSLSQLFAMAIATNVAAKHASVATVLAAQKVEEIRAEPGAGAASGVDHADRWGSVLGSGLPPPLGAIYTRRWWIHEWPSGAGRTLVIQVTVEPVHDSADGGARARGEAARVIAALTRSVP